MSKWLLLFSLFCSLSYGRTLSDREFAERIKRGCERIISEHEKHLHIGVEIVSLKTEKPLYSKNTDHLFIPGSSAKLFTALCALHLLGPDYKFETKLLSYGDIKEGVLIGDLFIKGGGDPSLEIDDLEELVMQLKKQGITKIQGNLFIDNFLFDEEKKAPCTVHDDPPVFWNCSIDALSSCHNCHCIMLAPSEEGKAPCVSCQPFTRSLNITNRAITCSGKNTSYTVLPNSHGYLIEGTLGKLEPCQKRYVAVKDPAFFTASIFLDLLKKAGITITGHIEKKETGLYQKILASHSSLPFSLLLRTMMKKSDNFYADTIFKALGAQFKKVGSWQNGKECIMEHAKREWMIEDDFTLLDGSGLSRQSLISPHQITTLLKWAYHSSEYFPEFFSSLSVAGCDGTLKLRMLDNASCNNLHAKTGTLSGVSAVSGYIYTKDRELLAFSIFLNGFMGKHQFFRDEIEDEICSLLSSLSRY